MQRVDFDELEIDFGDGETYYWRGRPFTGMAYELRPDGSLWDEVEYKDGLRHNVARSWYPGGQIESETTYYEGSIYGADREWDEAGRLRKESIHEYNYLMRERTWDEAGRLIQEERIDPERPKYARLLKAREAYDRYLDTGQKVQLKALLDED